MTIDYEFSRENIYGVSDEAYVGRLKEIEVSNIIEATVRKCEIDVQLLKYRLDKVRDYYRTAKGEIPKYLAPLYREVSMDSMEELMSRVRTTRDKKMLLLKRYKKYDS